MSDIVEVVRPNNPAGYVKLAKEIFALLPWGDDIGELAKKVSPEELDARAGEFKRQMRAHIENDLYFLTRVCTSVADRMHPTLGRQMDRDYLFRMWRKLEELRLTGKLHGLWMYHSRAAYKTTSIQQLCMQEILRNPNIRIAYYSRTMDPMATDRVAGIRQEFENNPLLNLVYPDILWGEYESGGEDGPANWGKKSFTVRRYGTGLTMSEPTVKCCGVNGTLYTGGHPDINVFDDPFDRTNSTNREQVVKTCDIIQDAKKISDPSQNRQDWFIGTKWYEGGGYDTLKSRGLIKRVWLESALDWSKPRPDLQDIGGAEPRFLTADELRDYRGTGAEAWSDYCLQYLCRTDLAGRKPLNSGDLETYHRKPHEIASGALLYMVMDPGGTPGLSRDSSIDDTAIEVWAAREDHNLYLVDAISDILHPAQRAKVLIALHRKWSKVAPIKQVRVEEVGSAADVTIILQQQLAEAYAFDVMRVTRGGNAEKPKKDRIYSQVEPLLSEGHLHVPRKLIRVRRGSKNDIVGHFRNAIDTFLTTGDDHLLDALSMLNEPEDKACQIRRGKRVTKTTIGPLVYAKGRRSGINIPPDRLAARVPKADAWMFAGTGV